MIRQITLAVTVLLIASAASGADMVTRAEATELRHADGTVVARVERDHDGNVIQLLLNDMRLASDEVAELGSLAQLRRLVLFQTNFGDGDLPLLNQCQNLERLNLTSSDVTDDCQAAKPFSRNDGERETERAFEEERDGSIQNAPESQSAGP